MTPFLTRRGALVSGLAFGASAVATGCDGRGGGADASTLTLWGPPAGPTIVLAYAADLSLMDTLAEKVAVKAWRSPDELRAGLTSGTIQLSVMPLNTAASLYNRGQDVRLLNVMTDGLLYVVSPDARITGPRHLKGRSLAVPYRRDAPDVVLRSLLAFHGLVPGADVTIRNTGSPIEAVQLMLTGAVDAAFVPEPAASAAILGGRLVGKTVSRVIDVQHHWRAVVGDPAATLPQAGLAVKGLFHRDNAERLSRLNRVLADAAVAVNANPKAAARAAAGSLGMPAAILEAAIPFSNLRVVEAKAARPAIDRFFSTIAAADPAILGGRAPDEGFYL
ncbi:ABC transporter substrate-binding protein [Brevundimonas sp.]|uniref:ABC transporter substrate-binding protein n=1 Tax=Brevundimonas sp. TaxID=1871086 RepID=UPI002C5C3A76|nr:ABC transporter substrate-binding protein [Brevundimonas sp.]HWQ87305.1 ABC transporter substrate-binding protein [Brevundimonas sp.]